MTDVKYFPLVDMDTDASVRFPMFPVTDESMVRRSGRPYLTELIPYRFRLCNSERHPDYEVRCPYCGRPMLCLSSESIPNALFVCEHCK